MRSIGALKAGVAKARGIVREAELVYDRHFNAAQATKNDSSRSDTWKRAELQRIAKEGSDELTVKAAAANELIKPLTAEKEFWLDQLLAIRAAYVAVPGEETTDAQQLRNAELQLRLAETTALPTGARARWIKDAVASGDWIRVYALQLGMQDDRSPLERLSDPQQLEIPAQKEALGLLNQAEALGDLATHLSHNLSAATTWTPNAPEHDGISGVARLSTARSRQDAGLTV